MSRRRQALSLRMTGLSNKEVGAAMGITERTVKGYLYELAQEAGASGAIETAVRLGLIASPGSHVHVPVCRDCGATFAPPRGAAGNPGTAPAHDGPGDRTPAAPREGGA